MIQGNVTRLRLHPRKAAQECWAKRSEKAERADRGKQCDAILGILEEGKEIIEDYKGTIALDAGLISAAQAVEHYEMARYGTLRTWARLLQMPAAVALLEATLGEERATDQKLSDLAKRVENSKAA